MAAHSMTNLEDLLNDTVIYSFCALQSTLVAGEVQKRHLKTLDDLKKEHAGCAAKMIALNELAESRLQTLQELQKEFNEFTLKVRSFESKMQDEVEKVLTQQAMRARVETMLEFQRGELSANDIPDTVRIYNEAYPEDAFNF
ncbi:hypothetical protein ACET3Z_032174 [Daucus carota]